MPCSLERQPAHRRAEPSLKGNQRRSMILHRRHCKEDKLREQRRCHGQGGWMVPSWNLQARPPRLEGKCHPEHVGRRLRSCHWQDSACDKSSSVDSGADSNSAQLRIQCQGMPSFTSATPLHEGNRICASGLLQTPAEPNSAGSFMQQKVSQR